MVISTLYNHYDKVPLSAWDYDDFTPEEVACSCCGAVKLHTRAMDALQHLRTRWGRPLMITSAYRCGRHNQAVGGANLSEHREGAAFDVSLGNYLRSDLVHTARQVGFTGVGLYDTFVHLDVRKHAAEWTK